MAASIQLGIAPFRFLPVLRAKLQLASLGLLALLAGPAHANCPAAPGYFLRSTTGSVTICPEPYQCSTSRPLLRQDVATGALVKLAPFCTQALCNQDDCVPPGHYRYGLETPLSCSGSCAPSAPYWVEVTVTSTPAADCAWTAGNAQPTSYPAAPPWPASGANVACDNRGGCSSAGAVLGIDGALFALGLVLTFRKRRA
jgi:hypothetical protein